ncbi:1-deoxy-D-xylulose-5-phosphate synthase [Dictyobacter sp. S3.2.2.5]|uniref:Pyruvate dehydrogenase E1 component n=2 Tax=Dictyobacter halimunensis TaxID=3026934 RepID=A0ABQ6FSA1_9CHLR|nr:1-deoxy-D-xylulose-5-phosphate synthase [Dictyobacter sp. S3.2.2.5]
MQRKISTTAKNSSKQQKQVRSAATPSAMELRPAPLEADEYQVLDSIQRRVLWLSTLIVHHANTRPNADDLKVGGHQASSASMVSILTALYFHYLHAGDRVSIKPHASPAYHAIQYLLGNLDQHYLQTLREFKGLQAYPSRTKDPDPVDFSTGSVGLGAVAPAFAAVAQRYAQQHFGEVTAQRFVAVIGDAELDEGNIWEAAIDETLHGAGNVLIIVDLNRQSLDRVVPGIRARQLKNLFAAAGWHTLEAKYGRLLEKVFAQPGGAALRQRIDEMSNEEYQSLLRRQGADMRARLTHPGGLDQPADADICKVLQDVPDENLKELLANLGGHDLNTLLDVFAQADQRHDAPTIVFAYTIKGWGLPFAGDAMNHSMHLSGEQVRELQRAMNIPEGAEWEAFASGSAEAAWCRQSAERLSRGQLQPAPLIPAEKIPGSLDMSFPGKLSTQEALGRILTRLATLEGIGERIVTAAPDVAISTHLIGWVNKTGVFSPTMHPDYQDGIQRTLRWQPNPQGQHIELGISEMNLFMLLGQLGLSYEHSGQLLFPIGTVYDPFICRGLDALIYGLYNHSKMIFAGTPSGVSLSPEGGAHQSTVTASLGVELPELNYYEPVFAHEVEWILLEALRECCDRDEGRSTYLRLSTKKIDQQLLEEALQRLGEERLRQHVLAGGYRLLEGRDLAPEANEDEVIQIVTTGVMVPEALAAARILAREGIAANVIHLTSPRKIFSTYNGFRRSQSQGQTEPASAAHLRTLFPRSERLAPIVTVQDASAHSLAFLSGIHGVPCISLGVDEFGQSGSMSELYQAVGISTDDIVAAGYTALDLAQER